MRKYAPKNPPAALAAALESLLATRNGPLLLTRKAVWPDAETLAEWLGPDVAQTISAYGGPEVFTAATISLCREEPDTISFLARAVQIPRGRKSSAFITPLRHELAAEYGVHIDTVTTWKRRLLAELSARIQERAAQAA